MKLKAVNTDKSASQKGRKIGTAAGFGTGSAYLIKNRKDIFEKGIQNGIKQVTEHPNTDCNKFVKSVQNVLSNTTIKNQSKILAGAAGAIIVGATTAAGALIGKGIGTLVDKHNKKKQEYEFLKDKPAFVEAVMGKPTEVTMKNVGKVNKKINKMFKDAFCE